jgi:hypothetical protein
MVGSTRSDDSSGTGSHRTGYAVKTDSEGNALWEYSILGDAESALNAAREINGGYMLFGDGRNSNQDSVSLFFLPLYSNGEAVYDNVTTYILKLTYNLYFGAMSETLTHTYAIAANFNNGIGIFTIDPIGAFDYQAFNGGHASAITGASNTDLIIGGYSTDSMNQEKSSCLWRLSRDTFYNDTVWTSVYNTGTGDEDILSICQNETGFLVGGRRPNQGNNGASGFHSQYQDDGKRRSFSVDLFFQSLTPTITCVRTPSDTKVVYCISYSDSMMLVESDVKIYGGDPTFEYRSYSGAFYASDIQPTSDGGWIIAGYIVNPDSTTEALLLKLGQGTLDVPKHPDATEPTEMNLSLRR